MCVFVYVQYCILCAYVRIHVYAYGVCICVVCVWISVLPFCFFRGAVVLVCVSRSRSPPSCAPAPPAKPWVGMRAHVFLCGNGKKVVVVVVVVVAAAAAAARVYEGARARVYISSRRGRGGWG